MNKSIKIEEIKKNLVSYLRCLQITFNVLRLRSGWTEDAEHQTRPQPRPLRGHGRNGIPGRHFGRKITTSYESLRHTNPETKRGPKHALIRTPNALLTPPSSGTRVDDAGDETRRDERERSWHLGEPKLR